MQETCLNILNAQILLLTYVQAQNPAWVPWDRARFSVFISFAHLGSLYNTVVAFPVPGNADFQFYFKKRFLLIIQKKNKLYRRNKVCALFFLVSSFQFILYKKT